MLEYQTFFLSLSFQKCLDLLFYPNIALESFSCDWLALKTTEVMSPALRSWSSLSHSFFLSSLSRSNNLAKLFPTFDTRERVWISLFWVILKTIFHNSTTTKSKESIQIERNHIWNLSRFLYFAIVRQKEQSFFSLSRL